MYFCKHKADNTGKHTVHNGGQCGWHGLCHSVLLGDDRMTLQELTDMLQTWGHQGHAQDNVEFEVDNYIYKPDYIRVISKSRQLPTKTLRLCIERKVDKQG